MWRKMQGKDETRVWEQRFKVCNVLVEINKMKLSTFLRFDIFLVFFTLFCYNNNYIHLHLPLHRYSFCEAVE